ncbi:hypothetical protein [Grimontia sp. SpTr1]|uniref:hypothetical protein n=1 Tax=Grimontia sp. SpTr1 TaxID=2995319 RepID=UPI00248B71D9|nr:hypothetical protein [Grimontia sp. SpTr1]
MRNHIVVLTAIAALVGCASNSNQPEVKWISVKNTDEFTDVSSCKVTVGSLYTNKNVYTEVGKYYPFIEQVNGELRVGLQSGGQYKIPVGNAQFRIDSNKTWDILISETPLDLAPTLANLKPAYLESLSDDQKAMVAASYESAMEVSAQTMSPFTATTGEKAKNIIREMLAGKSLKYRTIGLNQAASSTGVYDLDMSLQNALADCGIEL